MKVKNDYGCLSHHLCDLSVFSVYRTLMLVALKQTKEDRARPRHRCQYFFFLQ